MRIKTSRDLVSSLRGASFRKVTVDLRSRTLRAIRTLGKLRRPSGPAR